MLQTQKNNGIRSPTLQTVLMVERYIDENSGECKKTELWNSLPKRVMWQTFQVIMEYLESIHKIAYDKEGYIVYICIVVFSWLSDNLHLSKGIVKFLSFHNLTYVRNGIAQSYA